MSSKIENKLANTAGLPKTFKKILSRQALNYLSIFAVGLGATVTTLDTAEAANVTIATTSAVNATNVTNLATDDLIITAADTTAIAVTLALDLSAVSDIVIGKNDNVIQATTLKIAPGASALTIVSNIKGVDATSNDNNNIAIESSVTNVASQLVTISGAITQGTNAKGAIDTIKVGSATAAGNAKFTGAVNGLALTVFGGNHADEDGTAEFNADLNTTSILLQDATGQSKIIFSSAGSDEIAGTIDGGADNEGTMQITSDGLSFAGVVGGNNDVGTLDIDGSVVMNAAVSAQTITVVADKTAEFDAAITATTITLAGTTGKLKVDGNVTVAGAITGGILQTTTGVSTFSGAVGTALLKTVVDADIGTTFNEAVIASTVTIADGKTVDFDKGLTATSTTLGSSTAGGTASFTSTAAQTIATDLVSFGTDKKGTIVSNNTHSTGAIFSGDIGTSALSIALITATDDTKFTGTVFTEAMTIANSKNVHVQGDLEIGDTDIIVAGSSGDLFFDGTAEQTISGTSAASVIKGNGAGEGLLKVSNAAKVNLDVIAGINGAELVSLTTSGTGHLILGKAGNEINDLIIGATTFVEISTDVAVGTDVITTSSVGDTIASGATFIMPSNMKSGTTFTLIANDDNVNVDEIAVDVTAGLRHSALTTYDVSVDIGDLNVTARDNASTVVAKNLGTTTNVGTALLQARSAMIAGSTTELSTINNVMNAENGMNSKEDTKLALQVAPQTEIISGSAVAAQGISGSVQGIMSNRMASLRSGDAYAGTGMSAGGSMSAKSGFIQAFGSKAEQKNRTIGSGTQSGFDADSSGIAIGFDGISDGGMTVGLSLSTSKTDLDSKGTGKAQSDMDTHTASVYMDKATDSGYIEGSLTYGTSENTTSRVVNAAGLNRTYTGAYDSQQISLNIGVGMPNDVGMGFVTPFASFTGTKIDTDAYTEKSNVASDALRLKINQDDVNSVVGSLGVKYHNVMDNGGTPMMSLALNNEFGDTTIKSTNTYQGGGTAFKTSTEVEKLSATLGVGYSLGNDYTSIEFAYEADANQEKYLSHGGSIRIVGKF
jgi:uncharacterized protein with beta-barrel porin domain